ncbi:type I restriction endonuclease [Paracoccus shanxieyensis]|uniref:type I restriction endonuclease n=1 Tax=Paracoccus shanxieyensis TaxID=2675752 RepID=UPI001E557A72|nr:type I restriction endonuclease [Paracoccus shanxieyensis]
MADFIQAIEALASRSMVAERQALTEEATKTAMILPFLQTLGFDVFSLDEVVPEFIADVGVKKGEKVDFALKIDGKIAMLVEVKPISSKLGDTQYSQLFRYFTVTEARLAILTNGREAWFFSDTDEPNKMDKKPFFKFDFQKHDRVQVQELSRFRKAVSQHMV